MNALKCLTNIITVAVVVALISIGCKKNHVKIYRVSSALKADFSFHSASYWIYRDSLTGDIDSAYVADYLESEGSASCVDPSSRREYINMTIQRRSITDSGADIGNSRAWVVTLVDDIIKFTTLDDLDTLARMQNLELTKYPFITGASLGGGGGCLTSFMDSACVCELLPSLLIGSTAYPNTAVSFHTNRAVGARYAYNDIMYLSAKTGLVKVVIDHPSQGVHHVWELQRYHVQ